MTAILCIVCGINASVALYVVYALRTWIAHLDRVQNETRGRSAIDRAFLDLECYFESKVRKDPGDMFSTAILFRIAQARQDLEVPGGSVQSQSAVHLSQSDRDVHQVGSTLPPRDQEYR